MQTKHLAKGTSRVAHVSAVGSTAIARGQYTTVWDYRRGYIATTDPSMAGLVAVGAICVGVAALAHALGAGGRETKDDRQSIRYSGRRC